MTAKIFYYKGQKVIFLQGKPCSRISLLVEGIFSSKVKKLLSKSYILLVKFAALKQCENMF